MHLRLGEAEAIADCLGLPIRDFVGGYTRVASNRGHLILTEREDGACVFLEGGNHCRIQEAKPAQCRDFPNEWNFPGYETKCRAVREALRSRGG